MPKFRINVLNFVKFTMLCFSLMWVYYSYVLLVHWTLKLIPRFGHVSGYLLVVLHCLPLQQRMTYRIAALIWQCLLCLASVYLRELCCSMLGVWGRCCLRSTELGVLLVPFASTSNRQNRPFLVVWNGLILVLRLLSRVRSDAFCSNLKTVLSSRAGSWTLLSSSHEGCYINL